MDNSHFTVLLNEAIDALAIEPGAKYIDATLGFGGHTDKICSLGGIVLGIEANNDMLSLAKERFKTYCPTLVCGNFRKIKDIAQKNDFLNASGVLFDLGVSMLHYKKLPLGFSYKRLDDVLDMRFEPSVGGLPAYEVLNIFPENALFSVFLSAMDTKVAKSLSRKVVHVREVKKFYKVSDFAPLAKGYEAQAFLALRICVNDEFGAIEEGIKGACEVIKRGGRIVVISFHSGEDRLVKRLFLDFEERKLGIASKRVQVPTREEIVTNDASRSAQMRIFIKNE